MAGEQTAETKPAGNTSNGQSGKPSREEILAGLDKIAAGNLQEEAKPEAKPPAEEKKPEEPAKKEPEPDEDPAEKIEREEREAETAAKADPDLDKRLSIVAKQEKRARDRDAQAKASIDAERLQLKRDRDAHEREVLSQRAEIEQFGKLKSRAKYDPAGTLRALGLTDEDLSLAGRQIWAQSKEGSADPKVSKEAAARLMKERESEDRISKLERELADERTSKQKEKEEASTRQQVEAYLDGIAKAVGDPHPLARRAMEKSPERAKRRFAEIAYALGERDGDEPDAEDVLVTYEKLRREELESDGVDVAAMLKTAKPKGEGTRTIGNDIGSQTAAKETGGKKKSHEEKKAELERELRAMDAKGR